MPLKWVCFFCFFDILSISIFQFNDNTVAMIVGQVFGENGAQFLEHYKVCF